MARKKSPKAQDKVKDKAQDKAGDQNDARIEDLLNKDVHIMRSPLLWFILLLIPVLAGFYTAFRSEVGEAPPKVNVEYTSADESAVAQKSIPQPVPSYEPGSLGQQNRRVVDPSLAGIASGGGRGSVIACDYAQWVGKQADAAMQEAIKAQGRPYRILPPGAMMTMDHSPERVNFEVNADGIITRVWCG